MEPNPPVASRKSRNRACQTSKFSRKMLESEWTDFAWNPIRARNRETGEVGHYCQKISPACTHCYAAAFNVQQRHKRKDGQPGKSGTGLDFVPASLPRLELFVDREELLSPLRRK